MTFVCPQCRGPVEEPGTCYACRSCARVYPIVCGIPDFRLRPDPYIGLDADRAKGARVLAAARTFEEAVRFYYSITPEVPPDLAERWTARTLAAPNIARMQLRDAGVAGLPGGRLLDIGCSTGALLEAAHGQFDEIVGVDVAFRWLAAGTMRLREAGVRAALVCANAESLPFPDGEFDVITCTDSLEHFAEPQAVVRESYRVAVSGARALFTTNNRYFPIEPHVNLFGVGYLPRSRQAAFVASRRRDVLPYRICLRSAPELSRMFRAAGYRRFQVEPAPLYAPGRPGRAVRALLETYTAVRRIPGLRALLALAGPQLRVLAVR